MQCPARTPSLGGVGKSLSSWWFFTPVPEFSQVGPHIPEKNTVLSPLLKEHSRTSLTPPSTSPLFTLLQWGHATHPQRTFLDQAHQELASSYSLLAIYLPCYLFIYFFFLALHCIALHCICSCQLISMVVFYDAKNSWCTQRKIHVTKQGHSHWVTSNSTIAQGQQ